MQIFRSPIAFVRQHHRRCEFVEVGEFRELLRVPLNLILHARVGVPTDCVQAGAEKRNDADRRANCDVLGPDEACKWNFKWC